MVFWYRIQTVGSKARTIDHPDSRAILYEETTYRFIHNIRNTCQCKRIPYTLYMWLVCTHNSNSACFFPLKLELWIIMFFFYISDGNNANMSFRFVIFCSIFSKRKLIDFLSVLDGFTNAKKMPLLFQDTDLSSSQLLQALVTTTDSNGMLCTSCSVRHTLAFWIVLVFVRMLKLVSSCSKDIIKVGLRRFLPNVKFVCYSFSIVCNFFSFRKLSWYV